MKLIHTADWHLGNSFHGHSRTEEHRHFLERLLDELVERQPDALLVAGDIYDSPNPPAAAEELLYDFLLRATTEVPGLQAVLIAGNHDSAGRLEAPAELLKTHNVYVRGTVRFLPDGTPDFGYHLLPLAERATGKAACVCLALPFLRGSDYPAGMSPEEGLRHFFGGLHKEVRRSPWKGLPVVTAAHFYAAGAEICAGERSERLVAGGQDCVDASVAARGTAYVALGHLHRAQQVRGAAATYYAGSALPMSFTERGYRHGVWQVEIDGEGATQVTRVGIEPLRRLVTIPEKGNAASAAEVLQAIGTLPKRKKGDPGDDWPYLEIRLAETQPEPTLMHDVTGMLVDRAVRFCRMLRVLPEAAGKTGAGRDASASPWTGGTEVPPLKLASDHYLARFGEEMPPALADRFRQAEQAAAQAADEEA